MKGKRGVDVENALRALKSWLEAVTAADLCRIRRFRCRARRALVVGEETAAFPSNHFIEVFVP